MLENLDECIKNSKVQCDGINVQPLFGKRTALASKPFKAGDVVERNLYREYFIYYE